MGGEENERMNEKVKESGRRRRERLTRDDRLVRWSDDLARPKGTMMGGEDQHSTLPVQAPPNESLFFWAPFPVLLLSVFVLPSIMDRVKG